MYQKLILVGRLGGDPDQRFTANGHAVTNFSLATNRRYNNSEGTLVEETIWWRITTWSKLAENCGLYLKKGNKAMIEGRLQGNEDGNPKIWTRNDGTPAASFEVTANMVLFLSDKGEASGEAPIQVEGSTPAATSVEEPEDIPF